jgi:hypothetical protein
VRTVGLSVERRAHRARSAEFEVAAYDHPPGVDRDFGGNRGAAQRRPHVRQQMTRRLQPEKTDPEERAEADRARQQCHEQRSAVIDAGDCRALHADAPPDRAR